MMSIKLYKEEAWKKNFKLKIFWKKQKKETSSKEDVIKASQNRQNRNNRYLCQAID